MFNVHTISLSEDKVIIYVDNLTVMIDTGRTSEKEMESLVGKINTIGFVLPPTRHFAARFRRRIIKCANGDNELDEEEIKDAKLWIKFIQKAGAGVNINMTVFCPHTGVCTFDACEIGLGGYTEGGIFWRFYLPPEWLGIFTLNILEYIASIFTVEFEIADTTHPFPNILARLDSTTADAWMWKSNFDPDDTIHTECGRHLGSLLIDNNTCLDSSWMAGEKNPVADSLSRDNHLTNLQLTYLFASLYPDQMPTSFRFLELTPSMLSFMTLLVHGKTEKTEFKKQPKKSALSTGRIGRNTLHILSGAGPLTSMASACTINVSSLPPTCTQFATDASRPELQSVPERFPRPSLKFRRPSWKGDETTQQRT